MSQQQVNATVTSHSGSDSSVFDLWADAYDLEPNPLLMLEERMAVTLLPSLQGCDVLDVGCGTGRWLNKLEKLGAASLSGIDSSSIMLQRARHKLGNTTMLYQSCSSNLPIEDCSKDLILSSFVLCYLNSLNMFALECARIVRPGGCILISDMHPTTASQREWKHVFHLNGVKIEIPTQSRVLKEIISIFCGYGFDIQTLIEPAFDFPERSIFESAGKLADYEDLNRVPAIYILKLRRQSPNCSPFLPEKAHTLQLIGAPIALEPYTWLEGTLRIEGNRIASIRKANNSSSAAVLDLSGYVILPGLINAHDHLEFGLFPNLGRTPEATPYQNSFEWAHEIHCIHSAIVEQYQRIPKMVHIWWGAIRNLLCGVTTVGHHNPAYSDF